MHHECLQSNYATDVQQSNEFRCYGECHAFSARSTLGYGFGVRENELAHLTDMCTVGTGRDWDSNVSFPWKPRENMSQLTISPTEKGSPHEAITGYLHFCRKCSLELYRPYQANSYEVFKFVAWIVSEKVQLTYTIMYTNVWNEVLSVDVTERGAARWRVNVTWTHHTRGAFVVGLQVFLLWCRGFPFQLRVTSSKTLFWMVPSWSSAFTKRKGENNFLSSGFLALNFK